ISASRRSSAADLPAGAKPHPQHCVQYATVRFYTDGPSAPCCASLAAIRASAAPALALASPKVSRAPATSPSSPTGGDHCRVQTEEEIADRPQRWHLPPARSKRTRLLSSRQCGG